MSTERTKRRTLELLARLSRSSLDLPSLQLEAIVALRPVVGFDRWCWPLADADALVPLAGLAEHDYGPRLSRSLELEHSGEDVAAMDVVARRPVPAATLSTETGGDLARSPRWQEVLRPSGIGDGAVVACRDALGCWGWIKAYRDTGDRCFDGDGLVFLARAAAAVAPALRRTFAAGCQSGASATDAPAVIVLDADLRVVSRTAGADRLLDALPAAALFAAWGMLPAVVYPVATRARQGAPGRAARALERAVDGRWLVIEAGRLEGDDFGRIAVTVRAATPSETFGLLARALALTARERQVVAAVLEGLDTKQISQRLFLSRYTVQDHLQAAFAKAGVRSRRELRATFGATARAA